MPKKFDLKQATKLLPVRKVSANKATAGRSLIIAGSKGMYGAAVLTAKGAARVGSGYVYVLTDGKKFDHCKHPDFLTVVWKNRKSIPNPLAIAIGPGLGKKSQTWVYLQWLVKSSADCVVIDADALNIVAKKNVSKLPSSWIATPHEGELGRLLNLPSTWIRKNRLKAVRMAQKKLGCIILLKGHHSLLATDSETFEIYSGNAALAKAGTGDVLTGMITGFLAQGLEPKSAALLGAYVHGKIADDWLHAKKDMLSLMASDLINAIPDTLYNLRMKI